MLATRSITAKRWKSASEEFTMLVTWALSLKSLRRWRMVCTSRKPATRANAPPTRATNMRPAAFALLCMPSVIELGKVRMMSQS